MKKFLFLIIMLFLSPCRHVYAQILFEDFFNYSTGSLTTVSDNIWITTNPALGFPIQVVEGNLTYEGYSSIGNGNMIFLDAGTTVRSGIKRILPGSVSTIYVSYLINVKDSNDIQGNPFFCLLDSYDLSKANVYIRNSLTPGYINIGFSKTTTPIYSNINYQLNSTILIVIKYQIKPGTGNDTTCLWINPPESDHEPVPDIKTWAGIDLNNINAIQFKQSPTSGNLYIDAIKVWTRWGDAPLPVELSLFTAEYQKNRIVLNWRTETETDNYGFIIERKSVNQDWEEIAFVKGNGNSNIPRYYSFEDINVTRYLEYSYRLKQLNNDGEFEYSEEVNVKTETPEEFLVYQNYPNPFNPVTEIRFLIPENGVVRLNIYNAIGEKTTSLADNYFPAGEHRIIWNAAHQNSGIYYCQIEYEGKIKTIKIILLK